MKNVMLAALAIALGLGTFAAAKPSHHHTAKSSALPIPLCNPDDTECTVGGH